MPKRAIALVGTRKGVGKTSRGNVEGSPTGIPHPLESICWDGDRPERVSYNACGPDANQIKEEPGLVDCPYWC